MTNEDLVIELEKYLKPYGFFKVTGGKSIVFEKDIDDKYVEGFGSVYTRYLVEGKKNNTVFEVSRYERNPKYKDGSKSDIIKVSTPREVWEEVDKLIKDNMDGQETRLSKALRKLKNSSAQEDFGEMYYKGEVVFPIKFTIPATIKFSTYAYKDKNGKIQYTVKDFDGFSFDKKMNLLTQKFDTVDNLVKAIKEFLKENKKGIKDIKVDNPYIEE